MFRVYRPARLIALGLAFTFALVAASSAIAAQPSLRGLKRPAPPPPAYVFAAINATARHERVTETTKVKGGHPKAYTEHLISGPSYRYDLYYGNGLLRRLSRGRAVYDASAGGACYGKTVWPKGAGYTAGYLLTEAATVEGYSAHKWYGGAVFSQPGGPGTTITWRWQDYDGLRGGGSMTLTKSGAVSTLTLVGVHGNVESRTHFTYPHHLKFPAAPTTICTAGGYPPIPAYVTAATAASASHQNIVATRGETPQENPPITLEYSADPYAISYYVNSTLVMLNTGGTVYNYAGSANGNCYDTEGASSQQSASEFVFKAIRQDFTEQSSAQALQTGTPLLNDPESFTELAFTEPASVIHYKNWGKNKLSGTFTLNAGGAIQRVTAHTSVGKKTLGATTTLSYPATLAVPVIPTNLCAA